MSLYRSLRSVQGKYNVFTSLRDDVDAQLARSKGALSQLTVAIKDNIATVEDSTTCASKILSGYRSPFDATVVRLLKEQGAVLVGKTNMDEFGMGSASTHSHYGPVLNPLYPEEKRVAGGSSGGSAAAVASGVVDVALGTDTGGSIRLPASYTGVVGFKPSYARLSRWGVVPYAQSLDTVGLLSKSVDKIAQVFAVLDKYDPNDPTSLREDVRERIPTRTTSQKLRIGVSADYNVAELSDSVRAAWLRSLQRLMDQGHELVPVGLPAIKHALSAYYIIAPSEAASNLSRYDGLRYGFRGEDTTLTSTRSSGFGDEVQKRILLGNFNLSSEAYANHFLKAQAIRELVCDEFNQIFRLPNPLKEENVKGRADGVDLLVTPTATGKAPTLEEFNTMRSGSEVNEYVNDVMTVPISLAGLPSVVVPWTHEGDTTGIQLVGQFGDDTLVLECAKLLQ